MEKAEHIYQIMKQDISDVSNEDLVFLETTLMQYLGHIENEIEFRRITEKEISKGDK